MKETREAGKARVVTVGEDSADRRLDNFLLHELKGVPRTRIYRMIRKGEVRVNKGRVRPDYRIVAGDAIRIPPAHGLRDDDPVVVAPSRASWILQCIMWADEQALVLNKPSGLAVHGGSGVSLGAIELLRAALPEYRSLELVHRLDRETSGCLLVAKKRSALRQLHEQFRAGDVGKTYTTLLTGKWRGTARKVELPLLVENRQQGERHVRPGEGGKSALTWFHPLERFSDTVLCRAELHTGRTHQIRVHAAAIGHPVAGDLRYGPDRPVPVGLKRLFLHAAELQFQHPVSGLRISLEAPLDAELERVLAVLRAGTPE